jgi:hypothetical protein
VAPQDVIWGATKTIAKGSPNCQCLRHDAAVDTFRRHVRRHVIKPNPPPFLANLTEVFRLVKKLVGPGQWVAGILVNKTAGIGKADEANRCQKYCPPRHGQIPPSEVPVPNRHTSLRLSLAARPQNGHAAMRNRDGQRLWVVSVVPAAKLES